MNRRIFRSSRVLFAIAVASAMTVCLTPSSQVDAQPGGETQRVEMELRRSTQRLLDAIAPGDVAVWDELLDADAIQVDENDVVRDKAAILKSLVPLGAGLVGSLAIDEFRVIQKGAVAVTTHEDNERLDYHGQLILSRFRWTDTWTHTPAGWRLLASQVLAVQKDPPVANLPKTPDCDYAGTYLLTKAISVSIHCSGNQLISTRRGQPDRRFNPEVHDVYFEPGAPRTRRIYLRAPPSGAVTGFVDRREGRDIYWKRVGH